MPRESFSILYYHTLFVSSSSFILYTCIFYTVYPYANKSLDNCNSTVVRLTRFEVLKGPGQKTPHSPPSFCDLILSSSAVSSRDQLRLQIISVPGGRTKITLLQENARSNSTFHCSYIFIHSTLTKHSFYIDSYFPHCYYLFAFSLAFLFLVYFYAFSSLVR